MLARNQIGIFEPLSWESQLLDTTRGEGEQRMRGRGVLNQSRIVKGNVRHNNRRKPRKDETFQNFAEDRSERN